MSYLQPVTIQGQGIEKQKLPALRKDFGEDLVPKKTPKIRHLQAICMAIWKGNVALLEGLTKFNNHLQVLGLSSKWGGGMCCPGWILKSESPSRISRLMREVHWNTIQVISRHSWTISLLKLMFLCNMTNQISEWSLDDDDDDDDQKWFSIF